MCGVLEEKKVNKNKKMSEKKENILFPSFEEFYKGKQNKRLRQRKNLLNYYIVLLWWLCYCCGVAIFIFFLFWAIALMMNKTKHRRRGIF